MRVILYVLLACLSLMSSVNAQINGPRLSPSEKIETTIGMVEVELIYSRPSMRNRKIFGALVPFNEIWRTGANLNTKITFSEDVRVGNQSLAAGSYSIFSIPSQTSWEIYFHKELNDYGAPKSLISENILATLIVKPMMLSDQVETFGFSFNEIPTYSIKKKIWGKFHLSNEKV